MGTVEEQAVQELIQNIVQRSDGKVWMDDWRPRFASLGPTPKDFMEQRPDLFQLNFHGRGFSVELVGEGEQMAKDMGAESGVFKGGKGKGGKFGAESEGPVRGGPMGGVVLAEPIKGKGGMMGGGKFMGGPKGGIVLAAPKGQAYGKGGDFGFGKGGDFGFGDDGGFGPKGGKWGGGGGGYGKSGKKGGPAYAALPNPNATGDLADQAIQEIREQMAARGEPKVWIEDWRQRYGPLGPSPKQFLESRPDVFNLQYSPSGKGYSVYLVEEDPFAEAAPAPAPAAQPFRPSGYGKGPAAAQFQTSDVLGELDTPSSNKESEQSCIDEITRLVKGSPDGRICILNWFRRFAHLAKSPRAFMESRPDKFVLSFTGNTYSVGLAVGGAQPGLAVPKAAANKRQPPMAISARPGPVKAARLDPSAPLAGAIGAAGHNNNPRNWGGPAAGAPASRAPPGLAQADSALDYLGDKEEDALAEIFDQLSKPNNNGKINFPNWMGRFGHLATNPRSFIEAHPDKFEIVPGPGQSFTVELC